MPDKKAKAKKQPELPSREQVLAFLAEYPGKAGKREIARAFGITGGARIALKRLLRQMSDDGLIEGRRKHVDLSGELHGVTVLTVTSRDADGELLAEPDSWDVETNGPPPLVLIEPASKNRRGPAPGVDDRILARITGKPADHEARYGASVIKVLERRPAEMLGVFVPTPRGGRIEPVNRRQRELEVTAAEAEGLADGDLVLAEIRKSTRNGPPTARIRERVGSMKSEKAVSMIAIFDHRLPFRFPQAVLDEADAAKPATARGREDWRKLPLITIDPADAKDHDDAVHAEPDLDNEGGFIVTVAIADVAYYVRPGSAMDREAQKRGNSAYFPDRVVPMLPERISNDLCSLRPRENRAAMAVRMRFDKSGRKTGHSFHRVLMRSAEKLSYEQAQAAIDGHPDEIAGPLLEPVLEPLWAAYRCLERGRRAREPLELDLPERKIRLTPDGHVDDIVTPPRLDAHKLIEEFMIQANVSAAETLEQHHTPLIYRIHDVPSPEKVETLAEFLKTLDIPLAKSGTMRPAQFNRVLAKAADTDKAHLVNQVVLRSQAQAEYNPANIGHFGLNLGRYAHFTSPIRRYADLLVHRALIAGPGDDKASPDEDRDAVLTEMGQHISFTERRAASAERDTVDRFTAAYMAERIGETLDGTVSGVTRFGLFVTLEPTGGDGLVTVFDLPDDRYHLHPKRQMLEGLRWGRRFMLGDRLRVRILEADAVSGTIRLKLADDDGVPEAEDEPAQQGERAWDPLAAKRRPPRRRAGPRSKKSRKITRDKR